MWFLLFALAGAQHEAYEFSEKLGDIRPENVFINDNGHIKVQCLHSHPLAKDNFRKSFEQEVTYLAPEDLEKLKQGLAENR